MNLEFVLGNRVMVGTVNAGRHDFEAAVRDLAVAELRFPGWLSRLMTRRIVGLDNFREALDALSAPDSVKVYVEVSSS